MKRRLSQKKNLLVVIVDSVCGSGWNGKSQHDQHLGGSRMKSIYNFRPKKKIHENLDERKCFNKRKYSKWFVDTLARSLPSLLLRVIIPRILASKKKRRPKIWNKRRQILRVCNILWHVVTTIIVTVTAVSREQIKPNNNIGRVVWKEIFNKKTPKEVRNLLRRVHNSPHNSMCRNSIQNVSWLRLKEFNKIFKIFLIS